MVDYEVFEEDLRELMEKHGIESFLLFTYIRDPSGFNQTWHLRRGNPGEYGMSLAANIAQDPDLAHMLYVSLKTGLEMANGEGEFSDDDDEEPRKH